MSVLPRVWPNIPWFQSRPSRLLLVFQLLSLPPCVDAGAAPWQTVRNAWKLVIPADGMLLNCELLQLPNVPTLFCKISIASCSDNLLESKSPIFHSPKTIVLLVPSLTSRTPIEPPPGPI